jgi:hypothetical protein
MFSALSAEQFPGPNNVGSWPLTVPYGHELRQLGEP